MVTYESWSTHQHDYLRSGQMAVCTVHVFHLSQSEKEKTGGSKDRVSAAELSPGKLGEGAETEPSSQGHSTKLGRFHVPLWGGSSVH